MAITSTEILEDSPQADGVRHIGVKFISHTGKEVIRRFWADKNFNINTGITAAIPDIEIYMAEQEVEEACAKIEKGEPIPKLEFATTEQLKMFVTEKKLVQEAEIADLTTRKTYLEGVK